MRVPGFPPAHEVRAASNAVALAHSLIDEGFDDAEAVARLREAPGGRIALERAARMVTLLNQPDTYPHSRVYRWLRAAAGEAVPAPTADEMETETEQRELREQPFPLSFGQLAGQVPALRDLERRARSDPESFLREASVREWTIGRRPPRSPHDREIRIYVGMSKAVDRLLGPKSGLADPVLARPSAVRAAVNHLRDLAGIDPMQWREARPPR
jgi:hypothetical protein